MVAHDAELDPPRSMDVLERPFDRVMSPPGSKSLTNRALILAALSSGESVLRAPLVSQDTCGLRDALASLGASCHVMNETPDAPGAWFMQGCAGRLPKGGRVMLGDGGTPSRFMLAAAALAMEDVVVDGSARMRERPVVEGIELLRRLGVELEGTGRPEHLPVTIRGAAGCAGGVLDVGQTASSQFISALLLIAPWTREGLTIRFTEAPTSRTYLELTVDLLRRLGGEVEAPGPDLIHVAPGSLDAFELAIEPDASSAIYWWAAAALVPGAKAHVSIPGESLQPDVLAVDLLESMGALVLRSPEGITVTGPDRLQGGTFDAEGCPDAAVMLAVVASRASGVTRIEGLHTLRVKETDRIHALACELAKTGCTVREHPDAIEIDPATVVPGPISVFTWNDHRMAMAFGVLGLVRPDVVIENPTCVNKSYPGFWDDRASLLD